ncbi:PLDc N-terminal domain-containing protein [Roseivirga sp.]|uniref:PLDc N-terminal domain-containing protein n=1 Tax=Roseivirga sp. TaxID=1964215 RepID=UPI003B8C68D9
MLLIGGISGPEALFLLSFFGIPLLLIVASLISILTSEFKDSQNKLIWVLVAIFVPVVGALLYLTIGRSQRLKTEPI